MKRRAYKKAMKTPASGDSFFKGPRWKGTDAPEAVAVEDVKLTGVGLPDDVFRIGCDHRTETGLE